MDCEKFDQIVIDALYDELDELTLAAARRHADGCKRCHDAWTRLEATQELGVLELVDPPAELEERILRAAAEASRNVPWPRKVGKAISWAASYAMRPQMAMAAVLLLMVGSSLLFLRARPDRSAAPGRVSVTERGVPEGTDDESPTLAPEPLPASDSRGVAQSHGARKDEEKRAELAASASASAVAAAPTATATASAGPGPDEELAIADEEKGSAGPAMPPPPSAPAANAAEGAGGAQDPYAAAMALYTAGKFAEAARAFDDVASSGAANAPSAALFAAKSVQASAGCTTAVSKYEAVASQFAGSGAAGDALWAAAACYKAIGSFDKAKQTYLALRQVAGYRDRAESEIANLDATSQQQHVATRKASAPAAAAAKPQATQVAPPAKPSPKKANTKE